MSLWKRFVRTWRALTLDELPNPSARDALEPLLDELAKRLPGNGAHYKFAIAMPSPDGSFKILAERGMDPTSVFTIEREANWKEKRSFFANALDLLDRPFAVYSTGTANYLDIQKPQGSGSRPTSSGSHFIVAIKHTLYYHQMPRNTLALVSIGIPKGQDVPEAGQEALYNSIYPVLKGIEGMLLGYRVAGVDSGSMNCTS